MSSPAPSSEYAYSTPGSKSGYSLRSSPSPSPSPSPSSRSSNPNSRESSPSPTSKVPTYPPLALSSIIVPTAPILGDDSHISQNLYLSNPYLQPIIQSARESLTEPNADIPTLLKHYISIIEPSSDDAEALFNATLHDAGIRDMVILKYADVQAQIDLKESQSGKIDFTPLQSEVSTLFMQTPDTYESGVHLRDLLCTHIETYSILVTKESAYKIRKESLASLVMLGEGVVGLGEGDMKRGVREYGIVVGKLGLAIERLLKEMGGIDGEMKGRQKGYLKREGLIRRVEGLVGSFGEELGGGRVDWTKLL
jgi:hypothetical protein